MICNSGVNGATARLANAQAVLVVLRSMISNPWCSPDPEEARGKDAACLPAVQITLPASASEAASGGLDEALDWVKIEFR